MDSVFLDPIFTKDKAKVKQTNSPTENKVKPTKTLKRSGSIQDALAGNTPTNTVAVNVTSASATTTTPQKQNTAVAFNQQQLNVVWKEMARKANDSPLLIATINKRYPMLQPGFVVQYPVQSAEEEKVMQLVKPRIIAYLKHRLQNTEIKFELIFIQEKAPQKSNASKTKQEALNTFNQLLTENPELAELRDRFNLDLE